MKYSHFWLYLWVLIPFSGLCQTEVMSFNIRYDSPEDNENWWEYRKGEVVDLIKNQQSDFVGIQEATPNQLLYLEKELDSYDYIDAYLITYGYGDLSIKAAGNALFGRADISGTLPIDLSKEYTRGFGIDRFKRVSEFKKKANSKYNLDSALDVIQQAIDDKVFPGAQIFISKNEDILLHSGFGNFSYELDDQLVDTSSIYDIASITKVLSAVPLTMKLVERRRLSVDSYVKEYYPNFTG